MKTIDRSELAGMLDANAPVVVLDVLPEYSYEARHLPGAVHASVAEPAFLEQVGTLVPDKDTEIVVYCTNRACALTSRAVLLLEREGYSKVRAYEGGLIDWQEAGMLLTGAESEATVPAVCETCKDCGCDTK